MVEENDGKSGLELWENQKLDWSHMGLWSERKRKEKETGDGKDKE